mgnify:CR=1 FL=1
MLAAAAAAVLSVPTWRAISPSQALEALHALAEYTPDEAGVAVQPAPAAPPAPAPGPAYRHGYGGGGGAARDAGGASGAASVDSFGVDGLADDHNVEDSSARSKSST